MYSDRLIEKANNSIAIMIYQQQINIKGTKHMLSWNSKDIKSDSTGNKTQS